jgi:type II restriction/modification system DNA methylase subunit YeeA
VLDPACGSGNFLYVALQLLLDLQHEVINFSDALGAGRFFISVSPSQLFGIEKNEYAHELAQVTIWIGYIQWMLKNGYGLPSEPILKKMDNIQNMDAILAFDAEGKPYEPEWPEATVIVGNPPFLGDRKMRQELSNKYVDDLRSVYNGRIIGVVDLVCYWFEKARAMVESGTIERAGLLATTTIRNGASRKILERIQETGNIFWAYSDRDWILDGATVHVSMVGFDNGSESTRSLDGQPVISINANLTTALDLTKAQTLQENLGLSFSGTKKYGPFDIDNNLAKEFLQDPGNPNQRPNSDVIKPWVNGLDIARGSRNMWIIDFGLDMSIDNAAQYEKPFEYAKMLVKPQRDKDRDKETREKWWLFQRPRPMMRGAISKLSRFIITLAVSKHRIFVWLTHPTLPDQQLIVIARSDDYFFGVLHSKIHELWSRKIGTQLREAESGGRYTPTNTFETFPFPWAPGSEPLDDPRVQAIAAAAKELVEMRERWLNAEGLPEADRKKRTLTNLYNARPTWLDLAHKRLDAAVFDAYGWPHELSDEQILERLLALNIQRA